MHLVWIDWLVEFRARHIAATAGLRCGSNSCLLARETHDDFLLWYLFEKLNALVGGDGYYPPPPMEPVTRFPSFPAWSPTQGCPQAGVGGRLKVSL